MRLPGSSRDLQVVDDLLVYAEAVDIDWKVGVDVAIRDGLIVMLIISIAIT